MPNDTVDITFSDLAILASDALQAVELELVTDTEAESVRAALADFNEVAANVNSHIDDHGHDEGFTVSVPTLALRWISLAAGQYVGHIRSEGWVPASKLRLGDWIVADHFTEGAVVRIIDGGVAGRVVIVEDNDGDEHTLTPTPGNWFEVTESPFVEGGRRNSVEESDDAPVAPMPEKPRTVVNMAEELRYRIVTDGGGLMSMAFDGYGLSGALGDQVRLIDEIIEQAQAAEPPTDLERMAGEYPTATVGPVPVDSGEVLLIDPAHLPSEVVAKVTSPNDAGVTVAAVAVTGDGLFRGDLFRTWPERG